jgi:hypothetical protein
MDCTGDGTLHSVCRHSMGMRYMIIEMNNGLNIFRYLAQTNNCLNDTAKNPHCEFCNIKREKKHLSALHKAYGQYSLSCGIDRREIRFCNDTGDCVLNAYKKSLHLNDK